MFYESYKDYLLSDEWKRKAQARAKIDAYKCCMCGCRGTQLNPLQAHHVTYRNIYREDINKDILTLCRNCHRAVHTMMNRCTDPEKGTHGWKDQLPITCHVLDGMIDTAVEIQE